MKIIQKITLNYYLFKLKFLWNKYLDIVDKIKEIQKELKISKVFISDEEDFSINYKLIKSLKERISKYKKKESRTKIKMYSIAIKLNIFDSNYQNFLEKCYDLNIDSKKVDFIRDFLKIYIKNKKNI